MKEARNAKTTEEVLSELQMSRDFWKNLAIAASFLLMMVMGALFDAKKSARSAAASAQSVSQRMILSNQELSTCNERLRVATRP